MKIRNLILLAAAAALVAGPALAVERQYGGGTAANTIYTPTADGGCTTFDTTVAAGLIHPDTGCPTGDPDHVGPRSYTIIDDNGGYPALPTLVAARSQSQLFNAFECKTTSNFDSLGAVDGCVVEITTDTLFNTAGAGDIDAFSITEVSPGDPGTDYQVIFPDIGNENLLSEGRGQYCTASCDDAVSIGNGGVACTPSEITRMETGFCAGVLGLVQDDWYEGPSSIVVVNPIQPGPWIFSNDMESFTVAGPYRYFALGNPGDPLYNVVYGLVTNVSASSGYAVPLAPIGALALGISLAYMGTATLRRKS